MISLAVCVLAYLVEVFLIIKHPLVPPTLLSVTAKMEIYHPLLALYRVLYEVRWNRMLLLRVAVLLVRCDRQMEGEEEEGCHLRG